MKKTFIFLLISFLSVLIYLIVFAIKRHLFPASVVLIEGASLLIFFVPCIILALFFCYKRKLVELEIGVAIFVVFFLGASCFNLTIPAIVDRSVSLYLLNNLDNKPEGMSIEEIKKNFLSVYFDNNYAIKKRLHEQSLVGYISYNEQNNHYYATKKGNRIMNFARLVSVIYNLDARIVKKIRNYNEE